MNKIPKLLSKTKLLRGFRCLKSIYLTIHHPELEAPITPNIQALFDQGNAVGSEARKYFPGGVLIDNTPWDFAGALGNTRAHIAAGSKIIYEAAFEYMGCYARADIIQYSPISQRWTIYEVKSTTKVKPEHIDDVGLQVWVMAKSGLPIEKINIMHLNSDCRYPDLSNLFKTEDVTEQVRANYLQVQPKLAEIFTTLRTENIPDIDLGPYCLTPTECMFAKHCWQEKKVPDLSIFELPNLRDRKWELYQNGVMSLDDPRLIGLNPLQERIVENYKTHQRYIDQHSIAAILSTWQFPLVFLDFETINPAIPRYQGCGPFHQVPFQFSVHLLEHPNAEITHKEFLHASTDDPRPTLIPALLEACQDQGSIVAYYSPFEAARIQELANFAPEHSAKLTALIARMVDPLPILKEHVYDYAFAGSFSLKSVAPALLGIDHGYDDMLIGNGSDAQRGFEELISIKTPAARKIILKQAMLDYCKKDTLVMVELVKWLYQLNQ